MADLSDGVIALPGGCGTLEELAGSHYLEAAGAVSEARRYSQRQRIFYDPLAGDAAPGDRADISCVREHSAIWHVANSPEEAVDLLYTTPVWSKEIRKFAAI